MKELLQNIQYILNPRRFLLQLSIGLRLKSTISILVSIIIIILGVVLYNYQKQIIMEQVKQNSFATIDDLIRFTDNEIDASKDRIGFFGHAAINYINSLGTYRSNNNEQIKYNAYFNYSTELTEIELPALYRGLLRLQGDTTIYDELNKIGIEFFIYYQKTDSFIVEILASHNQQALNNNTTFAFPLEYSGLWLLNNEEEPEITVSHWTGSKWVQTIRLFVKDANNEVAGAIVIGINERNELKLSEAFHSKTFYETGICYQVTEQGNITFHPALTNMFISEDPAFKEIASNREADKGQFIIIRDSTDLTKYLFYKYHPANYQNIVIDIPENEIFTSLTALRNGIIIAVAVLIISIYFIINYITRTITKRLDKAVNQAKCISSGDLTSSIPIDSADELAELGMALNQMNDILKNTVSGITTTVNEVNQSSTELGTISKNIAKGANTQASSLEEISSSMEEITGTVEQNTLNAKKTASISEDSAINIQNSSEVLHESVSYLNEIVEKISIINDISFQTNILALNAAVEAARAGEHGRGFSVVAQEVRNLAERSREAADDIGNVSNKGMTVAQEAGSKLTEHLPLVHQTADLVKDITTSSIEQSSGIEQINNAIQGLNSITQQNAAEANNIASNIDRLSDNSKTLTQLISFFKTNNT